MKLIDYQDIILKQNQKLNEYKEIILKQDERLKELEYNVFNLEKSRLQLDEEKEFYRKQVQRNSKANLHKVKELKAKIKRNRKYFIDIVDVLTTYLIDEDSLYDSFNIGINELKEHYLKLYDADFKFN